MKLSFDFPISRWDEGVPAGNGLLGAIIWGNDREVILSLDQATLWDERLPHAYGDKDWNFATLLRMIRGKKWDALKERFESPGKDPWPTKLRACRLILGLPKNDAWTKAEINIYTGEAVISSRRGKVAVVCLFADVVTATASSVRPTPCFPASASSCATRFADGSSIRWVTTAGCSPGRVCSSRSRSSRGSSHGAGGIATVARTSIGRQCRSLPCRAPLERHRPRESDCFNLKQPS